MAVNDIESGTGAHVNEQEDRSPKGHIRDSESQKNSSANGNESREYRSPATQIESEGDVNSELGEDDEKVGKPKVSFNLNSNNSDGLDQSKSTSQTYSRQPTSNLRGGGMRLSNSAPRRAASAVYGLLVWIGEQLSLGYTRWDRMRVDNALAGFLLLILALVFVIVIVVPVVIVVGIVFCVLLGVAILTDTLCTP